MRDAEKWEKKQSEKVNEICAAYPTVLRSNSANDSARPVVVNVIPHGTDGLECSPVKEPANSNPNLAMELTDYTARFKSASPKGDYT